MSATFILQAGWRDELSGTATFTRALLTGLEARGADVKVVEMRAEGESPAPAGATPRVGSGGRSGPRPSSVRLCLGYVKSTLKDFLHLWRNRRLLRGRTLVVNEFGCETMPIAARLFAPLGTVVTLAHTHAGDTEYANHPVRRIVERLCHRCATDVIYNSDAVREEWRCALGTQPKGRFIHYGIGEPDPSVPADYPSRPEGCIDFLCASRFVRWKGHRELIAAFTRAAERCSVPLRLILVGDGPTRQDCIKQALSAGFGAPENPPEQIMPDHNPSSNRPEQIVLILCGDMLAPHRPAIIFLGPRPGAARYVNAADIGIQLSIEPEAFGLVFLEAMSRGKPVIGTRIGGIPEVVGEEAGILVEAGNPEAAADAMVRLAESPERRRQLGRAGHRRWRERFHLDRMIDEYAAYLYGE